MNKVVKWILIGLGIAVVAFLIALPLFRGSMYGWRNVGFAPRMMQGFYPMGMLGMFGMMFLRVVIPLGVIALAVVGVVMLVRNGRPRNLPPVQPPQPPPAPRTCVKCGQVLHAEGEYCPFCGEHQ